jgi:hypothetical protein
MTIKSLNELKEEMRAVAAGEREPSPLPVKLSDELEIIQKMIAIYDAPEKWIQGAVAKNKDGKPVAWNNDDAFCFCMLGAISLAANNFELSLENRVTNRLNAITNVKKFHDFLWNLSVWNDNKTRKFEDVVELLQKAQKEIQKEITASVPSVAEG